MVRLGCEVVRLGWGVGGSGRKALVGGGPPGDSLGHGGNYGLQERLGGGPYLAVIAG